MRRKPLSKTPIPKKAVFRKLSLSELPEAERACLEQGLADEAAGRMSPVCVPKTRGLKVVVTDQVKNALPPELLKQFAQMIVNHVAAERRRKNTKPKSKHQRRPV